MAGRNASAYSLTLRYQATVYRSRPIGRGVRGNDQTARAMRLHPAHPLARITDHEHPDLPERGIGHRSRVRLASLSGDGNKNRSFFVPGPLDGATRRSGAPADAWISSVVHGQPAPAALAGATPSAILRRTTVVSDRIARDHMACLSIVLGGGSLMPETSLWVWPLIFVMMVGLEIVPMVIILRRVGLSPAWMALAFVPLVNVFLLWIFALAPWPALDRVENSN